MYEYIIETETALSELTIFVTAKKLEPSAKLTILINLHVTFLHKPQKLYMNFSYNYCKLPFVSFTR